jgi:5-oxoprolinase (ATP-hydrolysing)
VLPEPLYDHVVEVDERVMADGAVLRPLDLAAERGKLQAAFDAGYRAIAIVLVHGWRWTAHEAALAAAAREIGFTQVSASHEVEPLIKLIGRGDTSVVDAYLSPVLRRYVEKVVRGLGSSPERGGGARGARDGGGPPVHQSGAGEAGPLHHSASPSGPPPRSGEELCAPRLFFMQSNGGLTDAAKFRGKDAILSGPAGGIVGMARTAAEAGYDRVIGFDMGGTSTDVSHFAGTYERTSERAVAGVRVRAPMLEIHTVAAGGGSICQFDGSRFRVGPDSAGAARGRPATGAAGR